VEEERPKISFQERREDLALKSAREWNSIIVDLEELKNWSKEREIQVSMLKMLT